MSGWLPWMLALLACAAAGWFGWRLRRWRGRLRAISSLLGPEEAPESAWERAMWKDRTGGNEFNELLEALRMRDQRSRRMLRDETREKAVYQHLLDAIQHGFMIVDEGLRIRFANQVIHRLFRGNQELLDRPMLEVAKDHRLHELAREVIDSGRSAHAEIRMSVMQADGKEAVQRVFLAEVNPLKERPLDGAWIMLIDITDRVMTEQIRRDFVANASHELRTPLTLMQGYIETLRDGMITDRAGMRRALDTMAKHSHRILRLVEDMLTVSKLESSDVRLNVEPFDLRECGAAVVDHLRPLVERTGAEVRVDIPDDQPPLVGDRFYFEQILINLVENALKNNPRGPLKVVVSQRSGDGVHEVRVTDDGLGIPQSELPYIFKRFYRVDRTHGSSVPGTGLGLSIVRRAVEAHGGTIEARSVPGVETSFVMRFPSEAGAEESSGELVGEQLEQAGPVEVGHRA